jgi:dihydrolipoamide dehydrogenase
VTDHGLINLGIQMRTDVPHIDPEVAWVGLVEDQANANGRDKGVTKLRFDDSCGVNSGCHGHGRGHGKILGGGMVGTNAWGA